MKIMGNIVNQIYKINNIFFIIYEKKYILLYIFI